MACLIVASTHPYAGKSGIIGALLLEARARGLVAGYFKPVGTVAVTSGGIETDSDAAYLASLAGAEVPLSSVCPLIMSPELIEAALAGRGRRAVESVLEAFDAVAASSEVVLIEGPSDLTQGRALGLDLLQLTDLVCGSVLLVDRPSDAGVPDEVLRAHDALGDVLTGVIFNDVDADLAGTLEEHVVPYLRAAGVPVLGTLLHDSALSWVTVADMVAQLGGQVLCAHDAMDRTVESFMVGAMGHEKALRYFRMRDRKAVVTGGDRADVQLAALETDTAAIVCTGGTRPSERVLSRAEASHVPVILVEADTLSAVARLEETFGRVRVHDDGKVGRIREMLRAAVDLDAVFSALTPRSG